MSDIVDEILSVMAKFGTTKGGRAEAGWFEIGTVAEDGIDECSAGSVGGVGHSI